MGQFPRETSNTVCFITTDIEQHIHAYTCKIKSTAFPRSIFAIKRTARSSHRTVNIVCLPITLRQQ